mmetsp:Transcript_92791/g.271624  ORF Transcript_92791/g.271624 Transcript_92791/m.271624 type:complete len:445 (-) Transcript_92791:213-1547(-)
MEAAELVNVLGSALNDADVARQLGELLSYAELECLALLAQQVCTQGIDYEKLGVGWNHPEARLEYRRVGHASFQKSRARQDASRGAVLALAQRWLEGGHGESQRIQDLLALAASELGVKEKGWQLSLDALQLALRQELAMPLRALIEGQKTTTFNGDQLPAAAIAEKTLELARAVLEGRFKEWRYSNPVGQRQLEGLTDAQKYIWISSTLDLQGHGTDKIRVHEGRPEAQELDFFWATKIGGPSHGFDYESQCLLPLLCNARHKVILVEDPAWPYHPAGRAHFRLLWTVGGQPRLWLETVNADFLARREVELQVAEWREAVLGHAMAKADAMGVALSVDSDFGRMLKALAPSSGSVQAQQERLVLRPSNGVVEASDYLSYKHDWHQTEEETTAEIPRTIYTPGTARGAEGHEEPSLPTAPGDPFWKKWIMGPREESGCFNGRLC